ncbi:MAG: tRNA lysidine(34) synthetase TilS [Bacteroidota bacterium]
MNLNNLFVDYLTEKTSATLSSSYLLAVSGGVDSMSMIHLFYKAGLSFGVAHCNFSLRQQESDLDHRLVQSYCNQLKIPFYDIVFDTQNTADNQHLSIQETARNLRYNWFQKIAQEHTFDFIATAHHQDDNAETVLFNLIRGTGLKGLKGIPIQHHSIIRPLLFANKQALMQYANENGVPYREDASNLKNTYSRNKIRNTVMPILKDINSEAVKHIHELSEHSYAIAQIVKQHIEQLSEQIIEYEPHQTIINCGSVSEHPLVAFYLYELLSPYNFNPIQIKDIYHSLKATKSGNQFLSPSHTLTVNRTQIIIRQSAALTADTALLEKKEYCEFSIGLNTYTASIEQTQNESPFEAGTLYLDADLLTFPLAVRRWEKGDSFSPLGMKGKKKISDFLIDKKISLPDKQDVFVVLSKNKIVAILNHQIDDNVKTTHITRYILKITVQKKGETE